MAGIEYMAVLATAGALLALDDGNVGPLGKVSPMCAWSKRMACCIAACAALLTRVIW